MLQRKLLTQEQYHQDTENDMVLEQITDRQLEQWAGKKPKVEELEIVSPIWKEDHVQQLSAESDLNTDNACYKEKVLLFNCLDKNS